MFFLAMAYSFGVQLSFSNQSGLHCLARVDPSTPDGGDGGGELPVLFPVLLRQPDLRLKSEGNIGVGFGLFHGCGTHLLTPA